MWEAQTEDSVSQCSDIYTWRGSWHMKYTSESCLIRHNQGGAENSVDLYFQIQADRCKLILRRKVIFLHTICVLPEKSILTLGLWTEKWFDIRTECKMPRIGYFLKNLNFSSAYRFLNTITLYYCKQRLHICKDVTWICLDLSTSCINTTACRFV